MRAAHSDLLASISHEDWQKTVIALARLYRWRVAHFAKVQTQSGRWLTPARADGAGFPDLLLTRERVLAVELKTMSDTLRANQRAWLGAFREAGVVAVAWKPCDVDRVHEELARVDPAALSPKLRRTDAPFY